jgi:hypothetical protein
MKNFCLFDEQTINGLRTIAQLLFSVSCLIFSKNFRIHWYFNSISPCSCIHVLSPCLCLYVHISLHVSISPCRHVSMSMSPCPYVSMSPRLCLHVHVSMYPCLHVSMSLCLYISMSLCLHSQCLHIFQRFRAFMSTSKCLHVSMFPCDVHVSKLPKYVQ